VIEKLRESGLSIKTLTCVADRSAAEEAFAKGAGAVLSLRLGGSLTPGLSSVAGEFTVRSVHSGEFKLAGPAGKGMRVRLGKTAVLETGSITVLVCESPMMCGDLNFFRSFGIDPLDYQLVVIKANTSFRENYEPLALSIHIADTPGAASANLKALPFKNLPKDIYRGFER
jgi:microcystin degradation protein MlrC